MTHRCSLILLLGLNLLLAVEAWAAEQVETSSTSTTAIAFARSSTDAAAAPASVSAPASILESFDFKVSGYVQADAVLMDQAAVDELDPATRVPLNTERVLLRRARLSARASYEFAHASIEIDGDTVQGPRLRIISGEASLRVPIYTDDEDRVTLFSATIGLFKTPFGFDVQERFDERVFIEAMQMSLGLFPGFYDLGIKLQGGYGAFRYQLALMNGHPALDPMFPAQAPTSKREFVGRIGVAMRPIPLLRVDAGVSALKGTGLHPGTPTTKTSVSWTDNNDNGLIELTELEPIGGVAGSPSQPFGREALGADVRLRTDVPLLGTLMVSGELIVARNLDRGLLPADPIAAGRDFRERGFGVVVAQQVTKHALLAFRYDHYNPDADANDQQGTELVPEQPVFSSAAIVAAWTSLDFVRIALEYAHNDNKLARDVNGIPTRLANDTLTMRAQVKFP